MLQPVLSGRCLSLYIDGTGAGPDDSADSCLLIATHAATAAPPPRLAAVVSSNFFPTVGPSRFSLAGGQESREPSQARGCAGAMSSPSAKEEADSAGVKLDKVNDVADAPRLTSSQSEQAITAAEGRGDSGKKKRKRKKDRKKDSRKEKKRKRRSKSGGVSTREKRVRHELAGIIRDPPFNVSAGPKSEDNIFDWYW